MLPASQPRDSGEILLCSPEGFLFAVWFPVASLEWPPQDHYDELVFFLGLVSRVLERL